MDDNQAGAGIRLFTTTGTLLYDAATSESVKAAVEEALGKGIPLLHVDLSGADLSDLSADGGIFQQASFKKACLARASFQGCDLTGADFSRANLSMADLSHGILDGASFRQAILGGASLRKARFRSACFDFAQMPWTDAVSANGASASFKAASLPHSNFCDADLKETNFSKAHIQGASFEGAALDGANFQQATFGPESVECLETSFEAASLAGADFSDVDVYAGAELNLRDCIFDPATKGPAEYGFPEFTDGSPGPK